MTRRRLVFTLILLLLTMSAWPAIAGSASAPGPNSSGNVVSRLEHVVDVAWVTSNGSIQWAAWQRGKEWILSDEGKALNITGDGVANPSTAITFGSRRTDRLTLFWINQDGSIGTFYRDLEKWRPGGRDVAAEQPASGTSGIVSVSRNASSLDIFWINQQGAVARAAYSEDAWQPASEITDPDAADPSSRLAAVSPLGYPDRMVVFWVDPDGRLASSQNRGQEEWSTPTSLLTQTDAVSPHAGLVALARKTDHLDVVWITPKGAVQTLAWSDEGWQPNPTLIAPEGSADPASGLAAIAPDPHHLEVYWVSEDGEVFTAAADDDEPGWMLAPTPLAPAGSAAPRGMVAALARTPADRDVFWVTEEGQLGSIKWDPEAERWQDVVTIPPAL